MSGGYPTTRDSDKVPSKRHPVSRQKAIWTRITFRRRGRRPTCSKAISIYERNRIQRICALALVPALQLATKLWTVGEGPRGVPSYAQSEVEVRAPEREKKANYRLGLQTTSKYNRSWKKTKLSGYSFIAAVTGSDRPHTSAAIKTTKKRRMSRYIRRH